MSLDTHLIHTCTIENPAGNKVNAYNNKEKQFGIPIVNVRCRLVETRERVWSDERQESVIQTVYMLLLPKDITIEERAKISQVTIDGGTIITDTFTVDELILRNGRSAHHKTAILKRIS